jgi:hypothetical protein
MLQRHGGVVKGGGFCFFPDRNALHRDHGSLSARLSDAISVDALWVVGSNYFLAEGNPGKKIKRLLLPDPEGAALRHVFETAKVADTLKLIKDVTAAARRMETKVKWYDNFAYHSITLVDTDKPSGWIHVESVLPYSNSMKRPSWTLYKQQSAETVAEMKRIFDDMWEDAKVPPQS